MRRIPIYLVTQSIMGSDILEHYYFRTAVESADFFNSTAYTSGVRKIYSAEKSADRLIEATKMKLEGEVLMHGE